MGREQWKVLWRVESGRELVDRLNTIRDLDLTVLLMGITIMLASLFLWDKLKEAGLPMVTVSIGTLLITLKTQWEVGILVRLDD